VGREQAARIAGEQRLGLPRPRQANRRRPALRFARGAGDVFVHWGRRRGWQRHVDTRQGFSARQRHVGVTTGSRQDQRRRHHCQITRARPRPTRTTIRLSRRSRNPPNELEHILRQARGIAPLSAVKTIGPVGPRCPADLQSAFLCREVESDMASKFCVLAPPKVQQFNIHEEGDDRQRSGTVQLPTS